MRKTELIGVLAPAMMQWPHVVISEGLANLWFAAFGDADTKSFETAVMHVLLHKKDTFPLNISEVNEALETLKEASGEQMTVEAAWENVRYCARKWGLTHRDCAIMHCRPHVRLMSTIRAVGYDRICNATDNDRAYVKRDFEAAWATAKKRETLSQHRMLTTNTRGLDGKSERKAIESARR